MLDNTSLRAALALLMCTLLVLFYVVTYRTNRSAFAGWWCVTLATLMGGSMAYLTVGTVHSNWAIPLGHASNLVAVGCIWAAGRSLRLRPTPLWWLAIAPVVVAPLAAMDSPGEKVLPAGGFLLAGLWVLLGMATLEMAGAARTVHEDRAADVTAYRRSVWSLASASGIAGAFYFVRWVAFVVVGPEEPPFSTILGNEATSLVLVVVMTAVAFSMSTLSDEQHKLELRELAARDGLTGLLNRVGFLCLAEVQLARTEAEASQVIMADLDHFKQINDRYGHPAGDRALMAFAGICQASVRSGDLVARYGGEEFVLLLPGASPERALQVTGTIRTTLAARARTGDVILPTVSFGIAAVAGTMDEAIEHADQALYRAKETGRDRAVTYADIA